MRKGMYALQTLATILIFAFVLMIGCGSLDKPPIDSTTVEEMAPEQIASVVAKELMTQYKFLHIQVKDMLAIASPEQREWFYYEVTPRMDEVKKLLISYSDAVILWRKIGVEPVGIYEKEKLIREGIQTSIIKLVGR